MDLHTLSSSWALSREDRTAYLKAMAKDALRYGPDGRTPIGRREIIKGEQMVMTREGWRRP